MSLVIYLCILCCGAVDFRNAIYAPGRKLQNTDSLSYGGVAKDIQTTVKFLENSAIHVGMQSAKAQVRECLPFAKDVVHTAWSTLYHSCEAGHRAFFSSFPEILTVCLALHTLPPMYLIPKLLHLNSLHSACEMSRLCTLQQLKLKFLPLLADPKKFLLLVCFYIRTLTITEHLKGR